MDDPRDGGKTPALAKVRRGHEPTPLPGTERRWPRNGKSARSSSFPTRFAHAWGDASGTQLMPIALCCECAACALSGMSLDPLSYFALRFPAPVLRLRRTNGDRYHGLSPRDGRREKGCFLSVPKMRRHARCVTPARRAQSCQSVTTRRMVTPHLARGEAWPIAINIAKATTTDCLMIFRYTFSSQPYRSNKVGRAAIKG